MARRPGARMESATTAAKNAMAITYGSGSNTLSPAIVGITAASGAFSVGTRRQKQDWKNRRQFPVRQCMNLQSPPEPIDGSKCCECGADLHCEDLQRSARGPR